MSRTHTYTLASLELSRSAYEEIRMRLADAGAEYLADRVDDAGRIDMQGICVEIQDPQRDRPRPLRLGSFSASWRWYARIWEWQRYPGLAILDLGPLRVSWDAGLSRRPKAPGKLSDYYQGPDGRIDRGSR